MGLFFRRIRIGGRFPFIRLIQVRDNPLYLLHMAVKNLVFKREPVAKYRDRYAAMTFLSGQQTLEDLITHGKSLARFSDGEFEMITGAGIYPPDSDWCQRWSKPLVKDLLAALSSADPRLLVAVDPPETFLGERDSVHPIPFEYNMWIDMRRLMWRYLRPGRSYGHCHLFLRTNCPDLNWSQLREFFRDRDVIIATGNTHKLSHLVLGRRNFFIECGTEHAYEKKERIKADIRALITRENLDRSNTLVLASLGATAPILAHQLLDEGICVWDTGHMFEFAASGFIESVFDQAGAPEQKQGTI
ncbi:MAG: DUF1792 domain-containing protein [Pseudomonadota bacterium]|nr:DUF1792 domain-containing protein [Pseudomonadota bacterium]